MRIYIQWARSTAVNWQTIDIRRPQDWRGLPNKSEPTTGDEPIDEQPGWVNALNVQGVGFSGYDHYSATGDGTNINILGWQDSLRHFPPGTRYGVVYTFRPLRIDDGLRPPQLNTNQTATLYAEPGADLPPNQLAVARPWTGYPIPAANMQRHGKQLTDDQFRAHMQALTPHNWREWS